MLGYYLEICRVSSTDHIYLRAAKRRGDKFDQSMTRVKLLDNNPTLFIFYFYSYDDPRDLKQTTEPILGMPILGTAILGTNQLQPLLQ